MNVEQSTASYVMAYYPHVWKIGVRMSSDHAAWIEEEVEAHRGQAMVEHVQYAGYYEMLEVVGVANTNQDGTCSASSAITIKELDDVAPCAFAERYGMQPGVSCYYPRGHESGLGGLVVYFPLDINQRCCCPSPIRGGR